MSPKHPAAILLGLACALVLAACSSPPPSLKSEEPATRAAPSPAIAAPAPGELIEAASPELIPAAEASRTLRLASPFLLGTQIKTDLLERSGYSAWRRSRLPSMSDVRALRLAFSARLPEGGAERQSGMLYLPAPRSGETRELSWIIFLKGTELLRDNTPSRGKGNELPFIISAASLGYAVWVPDYSGMGDGQGAHEYCVAESLAASALDGLSAARSWLAREKPEGSAAYRESGRLALIGYSEGGLAAMGAAVAIAERRIETPGLELEAAYPMGAPLNLGIGVPRLGPAPAVFSRPDYQVFLALGWARAFPDRLKLGDIFLPRTIERIAPLFDGATSGEELCKKIAAAVGKRDGEVTDADLFTAEYCRALRSDPASTAYYRLQDEKRLDRWTPPAGLPIVLAASPTDEVVSFENSLNEYEWARARAPGSSLELVRLSNATHVKGAVEALLYAFLDLERREGEARSARAAPQKSPS